MAEPDEVAPLEARVKALEDALRFYADRDNWRALKLEDQFETGPAVDLGKRAREALSGPSGAWPTP